jgi:hypothetical protein
MKNKEEIEQLAQEIHYQFQNQGLDANGCFNQYQGYIKGYTQCQEDMADEIKKQIYDFTVDLKECTSTYVKQNCEGAIFGLNRLLNSLNKQD